MGNLSSGELTQFVVAVTLMLLFGKAFGEFFRKIKQAAVVGEIIAGIILGPTVDGFVSPDLFSQIFPSTGPVSHSIDALTSFSIILLLLAIGLEVDLGLLFKYGKSALLTTFFSMIIPFAAGFIFAYLFTGLFNIGGEDVLLFSFFIGVAFSISALPVIARTLMDLNLFKSNMGMLIIASAMFNDLIGWILFSIFLSIVESGEKGLPLSYTIPLTLGFALVMIFIVRKIFNKVIPWIQTNLSWPGGILGFIMVSGLVGAILTEKLGVHFIFGAFIVGVSIGDSENLGLKTREILQQFITNIFAPLFFVYIGLQINFIQAFNPLIILVVLVIGFSGKIAGAALGARLGGLNKDESLAVGFAMNARGVLEIVLALFALKYGIINDEILAAIIFLVIVSSVLSGPLINLAMRKGKTKELRDLITPNVVVFTALTTKEEVIRELVDLISKKHKLDPGEIFRLVMERESLISTGIGNSVAIPHSKIDIKHPVCAIAVNKKGIDFESIDGEPAKIIILLLTPKDKHELQLQFLAKIANTFREKLVVDGLVLAENKSDFFSKLQQVL